MADIGLEIGQVAIRVRDLDASVAFYRDRVGLSFMFQAPNVAFFDCGGVRLMLSLAQDDKKPFGTIVYFRVDDIRKSFTLMKERGITVAHDPELIARMADFDLWMAFFRDPDDNIFGIMAEVRDRATS